MSDPWEVAAKKLAKQVEGNARNSRDKSGSVPAQPPRRLTKAERRETKKRK